MNLSVLNQEQQQAVLCDSGYVRVIAGAGSGKTRVLTNRYLYLVQEKGIHPDRILTITFTKRAALEMKRRIQKELKDRKDFPYISTYHSFCLRFLKNEIAALGYNHGFTLLSEYKQKRSLENLLNNGMKFDADIYQLTLNLISEYKFKNTQYAHRMMDRNYPDHIVIEDDVSDRTTIDKYLLSQREHNFLDFDDLIIFASEILKSFPDVAERWQDKFDYLEVDEVQDTSSVEYSIIEALSTKNKNVFLVGDPDQNIYEWRHSDNQYLLDYDKNHADCKTIILKNNYRSSQRILNLANKVIAKNKKRISKELIAVRDVGEDIYYKEYMTDYEAAVDIIDKIKESIQRGEKYSDNAVLCRCQYTFKAIEDALSIKNIPFRIVGGVSFYDRSEIKDIIAYLNLFAYKDDPSLIKIINKPKRGFSPKKLKYLKSVQGNEPLFDTLRKHQDDEKLGEIDCYSLFETIDNCQIKAKNWGVYKTIEHILKDSGYLDYLSTLQGKDHFEIVNQFLRSVEEYLDQNPDVVTIKDYLDKNSFISDASDEKDAVELMTVHASKGLEFKNVYILACNKDFFPHKKTISERGKNGLEEERRLFYVAVTRAKDRLNIYASDQPSRFLKEGGLIS